jgi:Serine carboxypeptidase S28
VFLKLCLFWIVSLPAFAMIEGQQFHLESLRLKSLKSAQAGQFFDQKLNHKNSDSKTFKQRYFINSQYALSKDAPVFLLICGEWNCAGTSSYGFASSTLAKKFQAHVVAIEHRYYGESMPFTNLTTANLKYLNVESAIEDLKNIQTFIMKSQGLTGKWIAVGGSYAGSLAAFYRLKHPELVIGSLASSGPVLLKNEFYEYDAHIAKVINKSSCGDKVRATVKLIEAKLATPAGSDEVKQVFKATELKNNKDFLYVVADMLAAAVQYGRDAQFCQSLSSNPDLIQGYATGGLAALAAIGSTPFETSLAVGERVNATPDDNMRQWLWQSCSQFGWFQVANGKGLSASRSSQIDLKYHEEICDRLFSVKMVEDGKLNTDYYYPIFNPASTRIIFTNGANDPWMTLSVAEGNPQGQTQNTQMLMEGAAHCSDLKEITAIPAVQASQIQIESIMRGWLK